jgi:hypothetical protein
MASTYSTSLKLELIGQGEQSGTWGLTTNNNLGTLVEQAITGVQTISMSNATYTLSSYDGATDEARNAVLVMTGTNLAPQNLVAPAVEKVYIIKNTTGNTVNIKTSSGNAIAISNSTVAQVYCDGTDFFNAAPTINNLTGNFAATGTITSGGAMTSGGTLTAPTLSIAGTGSTGSNFSVGGTTYTNALVNYGTSSSGASTVTGNQTVTGIATSGYTYTSGFYDYGSAIIVQNLTVGGSITAGSIAGVTGIIKQIAGGSQFTGTPATSSEGQISTGHYAQITPTAASSRILVLFFATLSQGNIYATQGANAFLNIVRNSGALFGGANLQQVNVNVNNSGQASTYDSVSFSFVDSPNSTGLLTYEIFYSANGGGVAGYNNQRNAVLTLLEITQ